MLFLGPRIAEVDVNAFHLVVGIQHLKDALDVVCKDADIVNRLSCLFVRLFDVSFGQSQNIAFNVDCQEIDVRIADCFLRHKSAFAASQLQMKRLLFGKALLPAT